MFFRKVLSLSPFIRWASSQFWIPWRITSIAWYGPISWLRQPLTCNNIYLLYWRRLMAAAFLVPIFSTSIMLNSCSQLAHVEFATSSRWLVCRHFLQSLIQCTFWLVFQVFLRFLEQICKFRFFRCAPNFSQKRFGINWPCDARCNPHRHPLYKWICIVLHWTDSY